MVAEARAYEPRTLRRVIFGVYGTEAETAFRSAL